MRGTMIAAAWMALAAFGWAGGSARAGESAAGEAAPAAASDAWTLLKKMDFEKPGSQSAWVEDKAGRKAARVAFALTDDAHSGKQALKVALVNPDPPEAEAPKGCSFYVGCNIDKPLEKPSTLRMTMYVKGFDGAESPDAVFLLIPRDAEGKITAYKPDWGPVPAGDDWQEVGLEAKLPAEIKTMALSVKIRNFVAGAQLLIDDVAFEVKPTE